MAEVDWAASRERAATTLESYSDPGDPSRHFLDAAATRQPTELKELISSAVANGGRLSVVEWRGYQGGIEVTGRDV